MSKGKTLEAIVSMEGQVAPSFKKSIKVANASVDGFGKKLKSAGKTISKGVVAGITAASVAVGSLSGIAANNAASLQKEMSNVATLLDGTAAQVDSRIGELQKGIIQVSNSTGLDTSDLTDGLYQVISAVGDTEDSISNLKIAAKAATAGNATTTDSINLLTAVTKGYGDTSKKAFKKASDLAFQTVKLGQTSFPELAANIGKVTPLASALCVSQEELFGAAATLTGVTGGTAEVMTQMKAVLSGLMSPSEDMADSLKKIGYSTGSAAIESLGLQGTLNALGKTVGGDNQKLAKLFSSVEAQTAILSLAGSQANNFTNKTKAMYDATGATSKAFDAQTNNIDHTIASIKNLGKNFLTQIGTVALPEVENLASDALPMIAESLENIAPEVSNMVSAFATNTLPLTVDLLPAIVSGINELLPSISSITDTAVPLITTIMTEASPIVESVLPACANGLSSVFGFISENIGTIEALAAGIAAGAVAYNLINAGMAAYDVIAPIYTAMSTGAGISTTALGVAINSVCWPIVAVVAGIGALVAAVVLVIKNFDTVKSVAASLGTALVAVGNTIRSFFVACFSSVVGAIKQPFNSVIAMVNTIVEKINGLNLNIPDWVPILGGQNFAINLPVLPMLAKGGFTAGPSIAGEDGEEAVISFQKSVRRENINYWMNAGERLGIDFDKAYDTFGSSDSLYKSNIVNYYYELGGVSFEPTVIVQGNANKSDIDRSIRQQREEFFDLLDEWWDDKTGGGGGFGPAY